MVNPLQSAGFPSANAALPVEQMPSSPAPPAKPETATPPTDYQRTMQQLQGGYFSFQTIVPHLSNLDLSQQERYEIAFFIASNRSELYVCNNLKFFGLTDEPVISKLLQHIAKVKPTAICFSIEHLNLTEKLKLILAEIVAPKRGSQLGPSLHKWKITDQTALLRLADLVTTHSPERYDNFRQLLQPSKEKEALEKTILERGVQTKLFFSHTEDFRGAFLPYEKEASLLLPHLKKKITTLSSAQAKMQLEKWLLNQQMRLWALSRGPKGNAVLDAQAGASLNTKADASLSIQAGASSGTQAGASLSTKAGASLSTKAGASSGTQAGASLEALCEELMEYHCPEERTLLSDLLFTEFSNPSSLQRWIEVLPLNQKKQIHRHTLIPLALVVHLLPESEKGFVKQFGLQLAKERKALRYGPSLAIFIKYVLAIRKAPQEHRKSLLQHAFYETEDCIERLRLLTVLIIFDMPFFFKNRAYSLATLKKWRNKFLTSVLEINAQGVSIYDTLMGTWRDDVAPFVYAGKIQLLAEDEKKAMQAAYNKFISHVLNGTLRQLRSATCHLARLAPEVVQKWMTLAPMSLPLKGYLPKERAVKAANYEGWSIGVTDDPCDLMLLGKETDSCTSIDGAPKQNKCALAYMTDGKNLPVYIRGSDGKLKVRAILRLLHHKQAGKPALFLERHYNNLNDPLLSEALNTYASELAQMLDLPLFTKEALTEARRGRLHPCTLESFGSNAPFEYVDATLDEITQGVFTIEDAYVMFMPLKVTQPLRAIHDPNGIAFARHFGL